MTPTARTRAALRVDVDREQGRRSLSWFIRHAWPIVQHGEYSHNWHIDAICDHLQAVTRGQLRKLIINVPPSSMKSLSVCVFWSAWQWIIDPNIAQLFTSFDSKLTLRDGRRVQELVNSEWYRQRWGHRARIDPNESGAQFSIYSGAGQKTDGWRFATSVRGKTTGWHPNVKVIDDPTKPSEVTKDELAFVRDWHADTWSSRHRDPLTVAEVLIMQRLAEGDLAQHLLETGEYIHLNVPLEFERRRAYSTPWGKDPRTQEGETFWHSRFPTPVIAEIKRRFLHAIDIYEAQYQQNPTPSKGIIFLLEHLNAKKWVTLPSNGVYYQSWDLTFEGETTSDYVAGGLWLNVGQDDYLLDVYHAQIDFAATANVLLDKSKDPLWGRAQGKLIERKANGHAILSALRGKVGGMIPVKVDGGTGGKVTRARACSPRFIAGNVWLPESAPWLFAYKDEMHKFPRGAHDDLVDMTSQYLNHIHTPENEPVDLEAALAEARKVGLFG